MPVTDVVQVKIKCQNCGREHCLFARLTPNVKLEEEFIKKGCHPFPIDTNKLICECGFEHDLSGIRNQIETQLGKKIIGGE